MRRGLSAIRDLKDKQGSGGGGDSRRLIIKGGEVAIVRLYGDFENENDPVIAGTHFVKRLARGSQYNNCAADAHEKGEHAGCVFCYLKSTGDKGIGATNRAYFYVKDTRRYHKLDQAVRQLRPGVRLVPGKPANAADYDETQYPWCTARGGKPCAFCQMGNEAKTGGFRYWELAIQYADQVVSLQSEIRTYCKCGARDEEGNGTIYVTQYLCSNPECGATVNFSPENQAVAVCDACEQSLPPLEEIACTACDNAQRCDLQDFYIKVTRTGSDTDTSYNFEVIHPCKPPSAEELAEAEQNKPNFDEITAPEPAEIQAAKLGIGSPFAATPGHGAVAYAPTAKLPAPATGVRPPAPKAAGIAPRPAAPKLPPKQGGFKVPKLVAAAPPSDDVPYE